MDNGVSESPQCVGRSKKPRARVVCLHAILGLSSIGAIWLVPKTLGYDLVRNPDATILLALITMFPMVLLSYSLISLYESGATLNLPVSNCQRLARGIISLPIGALSIGFAAILFGAPLSLGSLRKTTLFGSFMSTLMVVPTACLKGTAWDDWVRLFACTRPLGVLEISICLPAHGAAIGAWVGAWPMPLDWAQPWQEWPICCTYGAVAGYVLGLLVASIMVARSKLQGQGHEKTL